jgi:hypothetical protein
MHNTAFGFLFFSSKIFRALWLLRGPFFATLACIIVINSDQFKEILRLYIEDNLSKTASQVFLGAGFLSLFSWLLWRISHDLFVVSDFLEIYNFRFAKWIRTLLPALIAALPVLGLGGALRSEYLALSQIQVASTAATGGKAGEVATVDANEVANAAKSSIRLRRLAVPERVTAAQMKTALEGPKGLWRAIRLLSYAAFFAAILILGLSLVRGLKTSAGGAMPPTDSPRSLRWNWAWFISILICVCFFGFQGYRAFSFIDPTAIARWFGTPAIIFLFFIFLMFLLSISTRIFDKYNIPVLSLVIAFGAFSSYHNWSNNHEVRTIPKGLVSPLPVYAAFEDWLERRPGALEPAGYVQSFIKKKGYFPVYLFAMEGGGHYASIFASLALAKLVDRCPALRHHIFAISGISGGGVGAGVFVAVLKSALSNKASPVNSDRCAGTLLEESPEDVGPLEGKIREFQSNDFLSPLAASALFGDLPQRAIPYPVKELDRARAFEAGLESIAEKTGLTDDKGKNLFAVDFLDHWSSDGGTPMLILNTTRVQSGEPIVIAPFLAGRKVGGQAVTNAGELKSVYTAFDNILPAGRSLPFSTALGLTARFPLLAPIGTLPRDATSDRDDRYDLVDGGYFENSGADALIALLNELSFYKTYPELLNVHPEDHAKHETAVNTLRKLKFKVIVLHQQSELHNEPEPLIELSAPINTLYRARQQRTTMAIDRVFSHEAVDGRVITFANRLLKIPLGWQLSGSSITSIANLVGTPDQCPPNLQKSIFEIHQTLDIVIPKNNTSRAADEARRLLYYMMANRCLLRDVIDDISVDSEGRTP